MLFTLFLQSNQDGELIYMGHHDNLTMQEVSEFMTKYQSYSWVDSMEVVKQETY